MRIWGFAVIGWALSAPAALAEECAAPCAGYASTGELSNAWIFKADPAALEANTLTYTSAHDLFAIPVENLKIAIGIASDQAIDPEAGKSTYFSGAGTYLETAYAEWTLDPLTLRAGKLDPEFSMASAEAPGLAATDIVDDLDADERWGGEIVYDFEAAGLKHALAGAAFTTDRTVLSESLFENRGRLRLSDGGAGNTTGVSSFSGILTGCSGADPGNCYSGGDWGYRLGLRYQRAGHATEEQREDELTPHPEWTVLGAAHWRTEIGENTLRLLGEAAYVRHFEGGESNAWLATGAAALEVAPVTYSATYTQQRNLVPGAADTSEHLADFSVLYQSEDGQPFAGATWSLGAGYTFAQNEDRERSHTLSSTLTLEFGGTTGGKK